MCRAARVRRWPTPFGDDDGFDVTWDEVTQAAANLALKLRGR